MAQSDFLFSSRVAIAGLGLMGGSLALALRDRCQTLLAVDPDPKTLALARRRHIVEKISSDPAEILPQADLIILAAPVGAILEMIPCLPVLHPGSPMVLDIGSTKTQICQAMEALPSRFDPLGGHPMCGKENLTLIHAEASLYQGATFAFTPLQRTSAQAREIAGQLARAVGAHPFWLDPLTHDRYTAATSHLPYLLASALALTTPEETSPLIGPGFQSTSRLAATPASMMADVLRSNKENILRVLKDFRSQLDLLEESLESEDCQALQELLSRSATQHNSLTADLKSRTRS